MSIASALNNAVSGLNAASRGAEVVSNNVANAQTPGYTRRSLELTPSITAGYGTGVSVAGVTLSRDLVTIATRRLADADLGFEATGGAALSRLSSVLGGPGDPRSLAEFATTFEAALTGAANDPASSAAQGQLLASATAYADLINEIARETRETRQDADAEIADQVTAMNTGLESIEELNADIKAVTIGGGDPSALIDQRKQVIDQISEIVPLKIVQRSDNAVAIFTREGGILLDGSARTLGFTATGLITPDMTLAAGSLSGLTLDGQPITIGDGSSNGRLDGGTLSALFEIRDVTTPEFNTKLDALAQDLIERFEDPAVDTTLVAGDPGLFTDNGIAYDPLNQTGLASRLSVNAAVDPAQGGDLWRLRDGINALAQGNIASSTILVNMSNAAARTQSAPAVLDITAPVSVAGLAEELTAQVSSAEFRSENRQTYLSAYQTSLREAESQQSGVETDTELQRLLLIEQAYSANARVISVVDGLLQRLLEI